MNTTLYCSLGSIIICTKEMEIRAKKESKSIEEVKPYYGSAYLKVHHLQEGGQVYKVDRFKDLNISSEARDQKIVEQRLMLEVSAIVDQELTKPGLPHYTVDNSPFVTEHKHINLIPKTLYALNLDSSHLKTRRGHTCIPKHPHMTEDGTYGTLLTGIMKIWANQIDSSSMDIIPWDEEEHLLQNGGSLTPFEVMTRVNSISNSLLDNEITSVSR